jgi:hypothetical protein
LHSEVALFTESQPINFKEKKWQKRRTSQVHSLEEAGIGAKDECLLGLER